MMGLTFPLVPTEGSDRKTVPWGLVEAHRQEIEQKHRKPLERLAALGGLELRELVGLIKGSPVTDVKAAEKEIADRIGVLKGGGYLKHIGKM